MAFFAEQRNMDSTDDIAAKKAWCYITSSSGVSISSRPYLSNDEEMIWMQTSLPPTLFIRRASLFRLGRRGEKKVLTIKKLTDECGIISARIKRKGNAEVLVDSQLLSEENNNQIFTSKLEVKIKVDGYTLTLRQCKGGLSIPDEVFEEYDLVSTMQDTKMSQLYKVRNKTTDQMCVLKVEQEEKKGSGRIRGEILMLQDLSHVNIINFVATNQRRDYLIVEYASGGDLEDYLMRNFGDATEKDAKVIFRQVLSAISYLHRQKIAHRDIKPENIVFMTKESVESVKLIDLGLSCHMPRYGGMSSPCGTFPFMSPIVMSNYLHRFRQTYTEKTDIWSFGVTLYDFFMGRYPFPESSDKVRYYQGVRNGRLKTEDYIFKQLSTPLQDVIRDCLAVEEYMRPSADSLLQHYSWFQ